MGEVASFSFVISIISMLSFLGPYKDIIKKNYRGYNVSIAIILVFTLLGKIFYWLLLNYVDYITEVLQP
jgi:hypothetical protein